METRSHEKIVTHPKSPIENSKRYLLNTISSFADFFFPRFCIFCLEKLSLQENVYCFKCFSNLPKIDDPICEICGAHVRNKIKKNLCQSCPQPPIFFKSAHALYYYTPIINVLIKSIKYSGRRDSAELAGKLMASYVLENMKLNKCDLIIPVPLHKYRFFKRGYNQAELLADEVCRFIKIPIMNKNLIRTKFTVKQSLIPFDERKSNVSGAFSVLYPELIKDKTILLIDDIITTGSTSNECSKMLIKSGAKEVIIFCLARA